MMSISIATCMICVYHTDLHLRHVLHSFLYQNGDEDNTRG